MKHTMIFHVNTARPTVMEDDSCLFSDLGKENKRGPCLPAQVSAFVMNKCPDLLLQVPSQVFSCQPFITITQSVRLTECLSALHIHVGPLHHVMSKVAGGAAAVPPPSTAPQHAILVTVKTLHQTNQSCPKTTTYCLTEQENPLVKVE